MHDGVQGFSVSPDGERIVSYGGDTLRMWEAATGEEVQARAVGTVHCATFTHDGERLVIGYNSGRVGIVDPTTLLESEGAEIAETPVGSCAVSPNDRRIACGTTNGMLWLWDRGSQRKLLLDSRDGRDVSACRFSPDGRWVAAGYGVGDGVRIWDATSGELVRYGPSESGRPRTMAFKPSSLDLMTARSDASLAVWPVDADEPAAVWYGGRFVDALAMSPDGSRVVCGHTGGAVMLLALEGLGFATPGASPV
jgi:WD40 repeat protein